MAIAQVQTWDCSGDQRFERIKQPIAAKTKESENACATTTSSSVESQFTFSGNSCPIGRSQIRRNDRRDAGCLNGWTVPFVVLAG